MQMIATIQTDDFDAFKKAFDAEAEAEKRMQAGLTLLQMWREMDAPKTVICLFDVNDRGKAQAWLDTEAQTGASMTGRFVRTA